MAVTIRLARAGAKKHPHYRIVVADSRRARDGKFLEHVGTYNPSSKPMLLDVKKDLVDAWMKKGAVPSQTVSELFKLAAKQPAAAPQTDKK